MTSSVTHRDTVPPFKIEHAFTLREGIDDLVVVGKTASQERGFINIAEGVLHGSGVNARQIFSGADHVHLGDDGYNMLDARVIFKTDDGAIIYVAYDGHLKANQLTGDSVYHLDRFLKRFAASEPLFFSSLEQTAHRR